MSDYIPMEILGEVIKRLPVKLLVQYRSVSKSWKCLIDSSEFIAGYGVYQTPPKRLLLWYADVIFREKSYVSLVDNETLVQQEIAATVPVLSKRLRLSHVVGSSRGLLCLYGNYHNSTVITVPVAVLWNPSIRKSVGIHVTREFPVSCPYTHLGFGVCPITNDPTIVKIEICRHGAFKAWVVEVFKLSTGSWRILSANLPSNSITVRRRDQVVIDRFIHWLGDEIMDATDGRSSRKSLIMSFDMTTHQFRRVDLPDNLARVSSENLCIAMLKGALAVIYCNIRIRTGGWDVWIMDDGVPNSFTKLVTISEQGGFLSRVGGNTSTGEPVFQKKYLPNLFTGSTFVYEPCSQYINDIRIIGYECSFYVGSYMESLLLLNPADCSIYFENSLVPIDSLCRPLTLNNPP